MSTRIQKTTLVVLGLGLVALGWSEAKAGCGLHRSYGYRCVYSRPVYVRPACPPPRPVCVQPVIEAPVCEAPAPVFIQPVVRPTIVAQPVAPAIVSVPTGATLSLAGDSFGLEPGRVILALPGLQFQTQVTAWGVGGIQVRLPQLPLATPTQAKLIVIRSDGQQMPLTINVVPTGIVQESAPSTPAASLANSDPDQATF